MKKVAVFVEGQTEQVFAAELVRHIFGHAKVDVATLQFSGKEVSYHEEKNSTKLQRHCPGLLRKGED